MELFINVKYMVQAGHCRSLMEAGLRLRLLLPADGDVCVPMSGGSHYKAATSIFSASSLRSEK